MFYIMSGSIGIASEKVRKKEEGRRKKEERRKKKEEPYLICRYFPNFYTNDTNGHDINC